MKCNYEIVTTVKCNGSTDIDVMDLPCFGVSGVLVRGELNLAVGIVLCSVPSCDMCQSVFVGTNNK